MKLNDLSHVEEGEPAGRPHDDCVVREPAAGGCGDSGHSQRGDRRQLRFKMARIKS
jgi:hypothetical protein